MHKKIIVSLLLAIAASTSYAEQITEVSATITSKPEKTWCHYAKKTTRSVIRCVSGLSLISLGSMGLFTAFKSVRIPHTIKNSSLSIQKRTKYADIITKNHRINSIATAIMSIYMIKKGFDWINKKFKWRDIAKIAGVSMITSAAHTLYLSEYLRIAKKIPLARQK